MNFLILLIRITPFASAFGEVIITSVFLSFLSSFNKMFMSLTDPSLSIEG